MQELTRASYVAGEKNASICLVCHDCCSEGGVLDAGAVAGCRRRAHGHFFGQVGAPLPLSSARDTQGSSVPRRLRRISMLFHQMRRTLPKSTRLLTATLLLHRDTSTPFLSLDLCLQLLPPTLPPTFCRGHPTRPVWQCCKFLRTPETIEQKLLFRKGQQPLCHQRSMKVTVATEEGKSSQVEVSPRSATCAPVCASACARLRS